MRGGVQDSLARPVGQKVLDPVASRTIPSSCSLWTSMPVIIVLTLIAVIDEEQPDIVIRGT